MTADLEIFRYDLAGSVVEIASSSADLALAVADPIATLQTSSVAPAVFRITVETGHPQPLPGTLIHAGPVLDEGHGVYHQSGDTYHFAFPGEIALVIDPPNRTSRIIVGAGFERRVGQSTGLLALEAAIDSAGQQIMHAASLVLPDRDAVVVIHAQSGTGKTTTSLALAGAGFGLCSDDATVLVSSQDGLLAWGFPRDVKVHRKTAAMLPMVAARLGEQWDGNDEQSVSLPHLAGAIGVATVQPRRVAGVFHLVRDGRATATIRPMSRTEALAVLAADNVRAGGPALLPLQARRFAALARLVSSVPVFEIRVGSDPVEVAALVRDAV